MDSFDLLSLNIRSAFRLLMHYTDRIVFLMNHISNKFKLPPFYDNSPFYQPVLHNKNNLRNYRDGAMNFLPLFFHVFHFRNEDEKVQLSIFILSDTGAFKDTKWDWNGAVDSFTDLESSKTRILFGITNAKGWNGDNIVYDYHGDFIKDELIITHEEKTMVFKSFELKDFKDEKTTNGTLKNFVEYAKSKGIAHIEYVE